MNIIFFIYKLIGDLLLFFDRPIAGNVNICPKQLQGAQSSIDFDRLVSTIKHEILHTLVIEKKNYINYLDFHCGFQVFSSGLYAFFRDINGKPYTERDSATRWPKNYDDK